MILGMGLGTGFVRSRGRYNLLTYTEAMDNGSWTQHGCGVTANAAAAPDGATTADKITEVATNADHYLRRIKSGVTSGQTATFSAHLKSAERSIGLLVCYDGAVNYAMRFDLSTGATAGKLTGTGYAGTTGGTVDAGNGWWRCWISFAVTSNAASAYWAIIGPQIATGDFSATAYLGVAGSGILAWGAQLEVGQLSPYQPIFTTV